MRKITVYTQSLNHLNERVFIFTIYIDGFNVSEDVKLLKKPEISEEDISEINKIIKTFLPEDDITIYALSAYVSRKNSLKDKWLNSNEGKEFMNLTSKYNVRLKRYNEENIILKNELIKTMTTFHKKIIHKQNNISKLSSFENESNTILKQNKVYNDNDKVQNIVTLFLRGSCNENKEGYYAALITKGEHKKVLIEKSTNTTSNRMLLTGLIEVVKVLKVPCLIRLYTHTNLGFSGGDTNKDLKENLFNLIKENNHAIIEIISNEKQQYLQTLIIKNEKMKS